MTVTARDVAKEAGVSPATVSLVFRNKPGVGAATRTRVLECAKKLGFVYGGSEGPQKTSTILLILYKQHGKVVSSTQFFEELIKGVSDATYRYGYHRLSVSYFYAQQDAAEQMEALRSVKCAGIILLATEIRAREIAQFEHLGVPIVLLDSWFPTKSLDSVVIDNSRGAWQAVRFLYSQGHRDIGYLHAGVNVRNFLERQQGVLSAMREIGIEQTPQIVRVGPSIESAYDDMNAFLETGPKLCSAYVADNDLIAAGCMRALTEHGVRIPEEVSIVGFDDTPLCEVTQPRLTTMAVPKASMGDLAVKRLADLIHGNSLGETIRVSVQPALVERDSVRRM